MTKSRKTRSSSKSNAAMLFNRYVWLVDTIYRAERILSFNYHLPRGLGFLFYKYAILARYKFLMLKAKLRLP